MNERKYINSAVAYKITEGNKELFCQLMDLFIEIEKEQVEKVHSAFDESNYEELSSAAHDIKSSASSLGAEVLFESALNLEQSSKKNLDLETLSTMIREVEKNIKLTIDEYRGLSWQAGFKEVS